MKILEDMFRGREEVIALVFGGSVAKGMERPDSDLDAMVIVTQEYFDQCMKENRTAECLSGCTDVYKRQAGITVPERQERLR